MSYGPTYVAELDGERLESQKAATLHFLLDGRWWELQDLTAAVSARLGRPCSDASISAKVRTLRTPKHGGYDIETERVSGGTWRYRLRGGGGPRSLFGEGDSGDGRGTLDALR